MGFAGLKIFWVRSPPLSAFRKAASSAIVSSPVSSTKIELAGEGTTARSTLDSSALSFRPRENLPPPPPPRYARAILNFDEKRNRRLRLSLALLTTAGVGAFGVGLGLWGKNLAESIPVARDQRYLDTLSGGASLFYDGDNLNNRGEALGNTLAPEMASNVQARANQQGLDAKGAVAELSEENEAKLANLQSQRQLYGAVALIGAGGMLVGLTGMAIGRHRYHMFKEGEVSRGVRRNPRVYTGTRLVAAAGTASFFISAALVARYGVNLGFDSLKAQGATAVAQKLKSLDPQAKVNTVEEAAHMLGLEKNPTLSPLLVRAGQIAEETGVSIPEALERVAEEAKSQEEASKKKTLTAAVVAGGSLGLVGLSLLFGSMVRFAGEGKLASKNRQQRVADLKFRPQFGETFGFGLSGRF